jgi:hypothetical protein
MAALYDVAPCSLVRRPVYRSFRGLTPSIISVMMKVVSSETSVSVYQSTRCFVPEDSHTHAHLLEKVSALLLYLCADNGPS